MNKPKLYIMTGLSGSGNPLSLRNWQKKIQIR